MRDRGLLFAWIVLIVLSLAAVGYAEFSYTPPATAGDANAGDAATGDAIEIDERAAASETGAALVGERPVGDTEAGAATSVETASTPEPPPPAPPTPVAAPTPEPAPPPVAPPPRIAFAAAAPPDDGKPRISIIMSEIGLGRARSRQAIERLPPEIVMAVMAYADNRAEWINAARAAGHEVLVAVPMEPVDYPRFDPGPAPLLIDADDLENLARLDRALAGATGHVGVLAHMGARFLADRDRLRPILAATEDRGLIFVDSRSGSDSAVAELSPALDLYVALNDRLVDEAPSREQIERRLGELEAIAKRRGFAIGIARPYPVTIERLRRWAETIEERELTLAPVTAVATQLER